MQDATERAKRLYFKTYLQLLENAVGSSMFRNFYMQTSDGSVFDALDNGDNSCAFFVSSVLTIFQKMTGVHGTVARTVEDALSKGWAAVAETDIQPGDLIVWASTEHSGGHEHIGFYMHDGIAISTSSSQRTVVSHNLHFDKEQRPIRQVLHYPQWD